jgi:hypothetical protein
MTKNNAEYKTVRLIVILLIVVLLISWLLFGICIYVGFTSNSEKSAQDTIIDTDGSASVWSGNQQLPRVASQAVDGIAIPGFSELVFYSGQTKQSVNFYNPEVNNCLFRMSLYINNELVWQSDLVQPGYGFYEIYLSRQYSNGNYFGYLKIECFSKDGIALNSARVNFNLTVITERK